MSGLARWGYLRSITISTSACFILSISGLHLYCACYRWMVLLHCLNRFGGWLVVPIASLTILNPPPILYLFEMVQVLFDHNFAGAAVNSTLCFSTFEVPFVKSRRPLLPGNPRGSYSSWPLFSLSHHLLVWWCAEKVYPGRYFDRYSSVVLWYSHRLLEGSGLLPWLWRACCSSFRCRF